jgi:hypothetical protein
MCRVRSDALFGTSYTGYPIINLLSTSEVASLVSMYVFTGFRMPKGSIDLHGLVMCIWINRLWAIDRYRGIEMQAPFSRLTWAT